MDNIKAFNDVLRRMKEIYEAKNKDYGSSYSLSPTLLGIPVHVGLLVRITDKMLRACMLAQQEGHVKDESLTDTLVDLANYAVLAVMAVESEKSGCDG